MKANENEELPDLNDSDLMEIDFHYFVDELQEYYPEFCQLSGIEADYFSVSTSQEGHYE